MTSPPAEAAGSPCHTHSSRGPAATDAAVGPGHLGLLDSVSSRAGCPGRATQHAAPEEGRWWGSRLGITGALAAAAALTGVSQESRRRKVLLVRYRKGQGQNKERRIRRGPGTGQACQGQCLPAPPCCPAHLPQFTNQNQGGEGPSSLIFSPQCHRLLGSRSQETLGQCQALSAQCNPCES